MEIRVKALLAHLVRAAVFGMRALERLTQPIYEPRADDGSGQCEQSLVNIKPPFETNSELAKPSKPRMGAFDNPAVFS